MRVPSLGAQFPKQHRSHLPPQFQQPDLNLWYVENHFPPEFIPPGAANYAVYYARNISRYNRIEFHVYDGMENLWSWKCRCEQYFEVQQVPEFLKIRIVYFSLTGDAVEWHHAFMEDKKGMVISWEMYTYHMRLRFDKNQLGSHCSN